MQKNETNVLGLWDLAHIPTVRDIIDPDYVGIITADYHAGSKNSLNPPLFTMLNGAVIQADVISKEIYEKHILFWKIAKIWKPDGLFFLGDLISACSTKLASRSQDIIPTIDEQTRASIQVQQDALIGLGSIPKYYIDGSGYHDSLDAKQHRVIAAAIQNGNYIPGGYLVKEISGQIVAMGHKTLNKAQYQAGIAEKDNFFKGYGNFTESLPDLRLTVGGHHHKFLHVGSKGLDHVLVPGWQGYYALKGSIGYIGKDQPDIGGVVLLAKEGNFLVVPYIFKVQTVRVNC